MKLENATLWYGTRSYPVTPNDTLPLPPEFDFGDPERCARLCLAIMSNASGGHRLTDCRVRIHHGRQTATIGSSGAFVHYMPEVRDKLTVEDALRITRETVTIELGSVVTDQYGEGYLRARWTSPEAVGA